MLTRFPLMLRALVLVPLLAVGLDQARVSLVCGPEARSCLDAAGQGRLGAAGTVLLIGYVLAVAALVARVARGRSALWIVATAGLWAACGGQALLASALGAGATLGGGWLPLLAFAAAAGAVLALALRAARRYLPRLRAPRLVVVVELAVLRAARLSPPAVSWVARLARDRAPPVIAA